MKLTIENVSKRYSANTLALQDFSLELNSGILGLLGPNGAGKTTLMSILATITWPTSGTIRWNGNEIWRLIQMRFAVYSDTCRRISAFIPTECRRISRIPGCGEGTRCRHIAPPHR